MLPASAALAAGEAAGWVAAQQTNKAGTKGNNVRGWEVNLSLAVHWLPRLRSTALLVGYVALWGWGLYFYYMGNCMLPACENIFVGGMEFQE